MDSREISRFCLFTNGGISYQNEILDAIFYYKWWNDTNKLSTNLGYPPNRWSCFGYCKSTEGKAVHWLSCSLFCTNYLKKHGTWSGSRLYKLIKSLRYRIWKSWKKPTSTVFRAMNHDYIRPQYMALNVDLLWDNNTVEGQIPLIDYDLSHFAFGTTASVSR